MKNKIQQVKEIIDKELNDMPIEDILRMDILDYRVERTKELLKQ